MTFSLVICTIGSGTTIARALSQRRRRTRSAMERTSLNFRTSNIPKSGGRLLLPRVCLPVGPKRGLTTWPLWIANLIPQRLRANSRQMQFKGPWAVRFPYLLPHRLSANRGQGRKSECLPKFSGSERKQLIKSIWTYTGRRSSWSSSGSLRRSRHQFKSV